MKEDNMESPKAEELDSNNIYSGTGAPWNFTHIITRTDTDLEANFDGGNSDQIEIPLDNPWKGYSLDANIKDLYDSRNWCNGTFAFGPDDGTANPGENDTLDIRNSFQNWTFSKTDLPTAVNVMSGNYIMSGNSDYLELCICEMINL